MQFWRLGCVSQSVFYFWSGISHFYLLFILFIHIFFYFPSLFYWFISGSKRSIFFEKKWIPNSRIIINHTWILFIFPFLKHIWEWRKKWFSSNSSVWFLLLLFVFFGLLVCWFVSEVTSKIPKHYQANTKLARFNWIHIFLIFFVKFKFAAPEKEISTVFFKEIFGEMKEKKLWMIIPFIVVHFIPRYVELREKTFPN